MNILANSIRPKTLDDVLGQEHLIGKGKVLRNLIENKKMFSLILYGTPGIGKTTLAKVIANEMDMPYEFLNATQNNKDDFLRAINDARLSGEKIIIIDEIHRMNKDKQDLQTMNASSEQELLQTKKLINLADKNIEQLQKKAKNNKFWTKVLVGAGVVTGFLINNQL